MTSDNDDLPVGRILNRREAVRLMAVGSAAMMVGYRPGTAASGLPKCVAKPEATVGPYFIDRQLNRSDIRSDPATKAVCEGAPLLLAFNVMQIEAGQCSALPGATVDVWQCDAVGVYSGVTDNTVGFETRGQKFLRGYQVTDARGIATFTTIYPGWYQGRAVHIHFKIRTPAKSALAGQDGSYEFTSQLFFNDAVTDQIHRQAPYASKGKRDRLNGDDGIYRRAGDSLLLDVALSQVGYSATFDVGLDLADARVGRPDRAGRPGR